MANFTDLSIFTNNNENGIKLSDRLNTVLVNSKYFDVLVGYFRITGFYLLSEQLEDVKEIRILIGLGLDQETVKAVDIFESSGATATITLQEMIRKEFNDTIDDSIEMENGIIKFCQWIAEGKLKIRLCYQKNVHAKLYIIRKDPTKVPDQFGNLITGSSNFTYNGLDKNIEFNVELKDYNNVKYSLDFFENLWEQSRDVTSDLVDTIKKDTWMNNNISPYKLFLKTIYTYFEEELTDIGHDYDWPEGYMHLRYQEDAVTQARKILAKHGGVIISDVVGLGKTYIAALLGKQLKGRKLFIVPPVVKDNWENVLAEFDYKKKDEVVSLGILDQIIERPDINSFDYIFVDEAHRFRNISTTTFQYLKKICYGKGVILITATPQNNTIMDIANLITLFQDTKNSSIIPNRPNIDNYFSDLKSELTKAKGTDSFESVLSAVAENIRDNVLRSVLIRRTRTEIQKYYSDDLKAQNLTFPTLEDPKPLTYVYNDDMESAFNQTIELLKTFSFARYSPLLYLKNKKLIGSNKARQENMKGFVKTMLVKRLESSIYAFLESIKRLQKSSRNFIDLYNKRGIVLVGADSKKVDFADLESLEETAFNFKIESKDIDRYERNEFVSEFINKVLKDDATLQKIYDLWKHYDLEDKDAKYDILKQTLNEHPSEQVIIFTEAKDTVDHLYRKLQNDFGNSIISFSGSDSRTKKNEIQDNFDPQFISKNINEKRILVTTDALSEGINLHRASILINYDLPWNPTRVMQRVGRINRVGSTHNLLRVYNFFPAANTREHLSLEESIRTKIQLFHELLGEDSKLITDDEKIESFELYDFLMMANKLPEEEEMASNSLQMSYIQKLNRIKEHDPDLFKEIQDMPEKVRVARSYSETQTITFIKQGYIKKFIAYQNQTSNEIEFEEAIKKIECEENEKPIALPKNYYSQFDSNKNYFQSIIDQSKIQNIISKGASPNEKLVKKMTSYLLKQDLNSQDKTYINDVHKAIQRGTLNSKIFKDLAKNLKGLNDIQSIIKTYKKYIDDAYLVERKNYDMSDSLKEDKVIVLTECLINEGDK